MNIHKIQKYRQKLLASIGEHSPSNISVKLLHESMNELNEVSIGFNTLRRFFGLLPQTNISLKTWRNLDIYLSAVQGVDTNHLWYFHDWIPYHNTLRSIHTQDIEKVVGEIKRYKGNIDLSYLLGMVTLIYINQFRKEEIERLFSDDEIFNENISGSFAEIISAFIRNSPSNVMTFIKSIANIKNFKNYIFYQYIDYSYLNGYYYDLLQILKPDDRAEYTFIQCMLGYREYLNKGATPPIHRVEPPELATYFPVLAGRYMGYRMLSEPNATDEIMASYLPLLVNRYPMHYIALELVPALVFLGKWKLINDLFSKHYEALYEMDQWYAYTTISIYLAAESMALLFEGNIQQAQHRLGSITPERTPNSYADYSKIFELMATYLIHCEKKEQKKAQKINNTFDHHVKQLGFLKLSNPYLQDFGNAFFRKKSQGISSST